MPVNGHSGFGSAADRALDGEQSVSTVAVAGLLAAFVAAWSLYHAVSGAPSAIHNDMAEAYVWGREFQLGYNQHPPVWAWIAGLWFWVFPRTGASFAILSSLNAGLGLLGSWMLIGDFARGRMRVAATLLLLLTPFYTFLAYKYNANSIFLSIWPWTLHVFMRSIDRRGSGDALLFGVLLALALLSKYFAVILGATCLLGALVHPDRRRYFASPAPYLSAAIAALLCVPHVWWLVARGAPPFHYFAHTAGHPAGEAIGYAAKVLLGAFAFQAVVILVIAAAARSRPAAWLATLRLHGRDPRFRLLATLAIAPLLLTVLAGLVFRTKISTNMTIGVFSLVPLLLIEMVDPQPRERLVRYAGRAAVALTAAALLAAPAIAYARMRLGFDANDVQPRKELAREATRLWHDATGSPLVYVAGSDLYENAVTFYSPDRPHGFLHFDFYRAPWVTHEDLMRHGLLSVCVVDDAECLRATAAFAGAGSTRTQVTLAHAFWGRTAKPATFAITVVPPQG